MKSFFALLLLFYCESISCQNTLESDPEIAQFVTSDIQRFWQIYDQPDLNKKSFEQYIEQGSKGLKGFISYRIESAKNLFKVVQARKKDYDNIRAGTFKVADSETETRRIYHVFKSMYPEAKFPPAYFVIGAFNSGGTISDDGVIIGVEMQKDIAQVPYIVAHELIHFNQHYTTEENTLLSQSIIEGSADFVGELISGKNINETAVSYGNANEATLCQEFVSIMNDTKYHGWLYGSKGKKTGRPNDLGYWMGYQICKSYYDKQSSKDQALIDILNIQDFKVFLKESGYLDAYL